MKDDCINKLKEKSSSEERKKLADVQNEFEKKTKSSCNFKIH